MVPIITIWEKVNSQSLIRFDYIPVHSYVLIDFGNHILNKIFNLLVVDGYIVNIFIVIDATSRLNFQ